MVSSVLVLQLSPRQQSTNLLPQPLFQALDPVILKLGALLFFPLRRQHCLEQFSLSWLGEVLLASNGWILGMLLSAMHRELPSAKHRVEVGKS